MARFAVALLLMASVTGASGGLVAAHATPTDEPDGPRAVIVGWQDPSHAGEALVGLVAHGARVNRGLSRGRGAVVAVPVGMDAVEYAERLAQLPGVTYAEPDWPVRALWTPDDPYFTATTDPMQWAPARIQASEAWDVARGDGVVIAVIDSGVDMDHPDLAAKIDAASGWDFVEDDAVPDDEYGHGTHCAGIAAAVTDNASGIAGIAPGATIMPVRVLDENGDGSMSLLADGIDWAVEHDADVVSLSLGGTYGTETLQQAVSRALHAGVVVLAASGNSGRSVLYPAAYQGVIAVGATGPDDARASYSCYGPELDVVAPGGTTVAKVWSTVPPLSEGGALYDYKSGTSMAGPHVAGLAALLLGERPGLIPDAVEWLIEQSALDLGAEGRDDYYGAGIVQARDTLDLMLSDVASPVTTATVTGDGGPEVRFTFGRSDEGLGIAATFVEVGGSVEDVTSSFTLRTPGVHDVTFWSTDRAGNVEEPQTVTVTVSDVIAPVTTADVRASYLRSAVITLSATDVGSGVADTYYRLDGSPEATGTTVAVSDYGTHTLEYWSVDLSANRETTRTATFEITGLPELSRVAGPDRYATALAASRSAYADGACSTVLIASGADYPDALGAAALAGVLDAPILLTRPGGLPDGVLDEIRRLGASRVLIIGGPPAVSEGVAEGLSRTGLAVERVAGPNRYATARAVAARCGAEGGGSPGRVVLVRGDSFADALSVAPIGFAMHYPILLTRTDALPAETRVAIIESGAGEVLIVGGTPAVSEDVAREVAGLPGLEVRRVAGADRYETAVLVAESAVAMGWSQPNEIGITTGTNFPDALAAGPVTGRGGGVVLLTRPDVLPAGVRSFIAGALAPESPIRIFGSPAAVSDGVAATLGAITLR